MILTIPIKIEESEYEVEVEVSSTFEVHRCRCDQLDEYSPSLACEIKDKVMEYLQENHAKILDDLEDSRGERKWEMDENR